MSQAATIWQSDSWRKLLVFPGPIMPQPKTAMVMRLDGAFCPKTREGTMVGNPRATAPVARNCRREERGMRFMMDDDRSVPPILAKAKPNAASILRLRYGPEKPKMGSMNQ